MYLITYYTENPLLDNGGSYGQTVRQSPVAFLETVEIERSECSKVFIINVLPVSEEEARRLEEIDVIS